MATFVPRAIFCFNFQWNQPSVSRWQCSLPLSDPGQHVSQSQNKQGCSGIVILGLTHLYKANLMLFQLPSVYSQNAKTKSIALSFSDMVGAVLSSWSLLVMIASLSSSSSDLSGQTSRRHRFLNPINVVGNFALGKSPNMGFFLLLDNSKLLSCLFLDIHDDHIP